MRGVIELPPDKLGTIFQEIPTEVRFAWKIYRELGRVALGYLQKECWEHARRTGYFALDGWLFGWVGYPHDRRFQVLPGCGSLRPESDVEKTWYFHIYGRNP